MNKRYCIFCFMLLILIPVPMFAEITCRFISFEDIKPKGSNLDECWGGIGIDKKGKVYLGISDRFGEGPDNAFIFRYDTNTDQREYLTSLRDISKADSNLGPNENWPFEETIAKLHTQIVEHNGKLYFASQDYHHLSTGVYGLGTPDSTDHRGGHFYSYDLATEEFEDLSKYEEYGVSVRYQGIIAMDVLKRENKLVGWTFPLGDIIIFDLNTKQSKLFPGVPEYLRANVSRKIIAARNGKVYFSYDMYDSFWLWELDIHSGEMKRTKKPNILSNGLINGMVKTKDESIVYMQTPFGDLHAFYADEERLDNMGSCLTEQELGQGWKIKRALGIVLSKDEKKIFSLPYRMFEGSPCGLYEFNIETGEKSKIADFSSKLDGYVITGSGVVDDYGNIYFTCHKDVSGKGKNACLLQININDRLH